MAMDESGPTRRSFIAQTSVAGGAALAAPLFLPGISRANQAGDKLSHASIGVAGMGGVDLPTIAGHPQVNITAICDVDANHLAGAKAKFPDARAYADWRELLEKEGDKIDSINLAVPDHMHAAIATTAIRMGKHVYCQKPLCHDVAEVRTLTEEAAKQGVVTQLGTQHASGMGDRMGVEYLKSGVIGKVHRVILCSNRPGAIDAYRLHGPRPEQGEKAPDHLNWDLWIGTAPYREFSPGIYHTMKWRAWQDFGTGWSGDIGCHVFDAPWRALGLTAPKSVVASVQESWRLDPARMRDNWPQSDVIRWIFPGNELTTEEVSVEWYDGLYFPPDDVRLRSEMPNYPGESAMAIGTEGAMLLVHGGPPYLFPSDRFKDVPKPKLEPQNHYMNFVDSCLGKHASYSPFSHAGPMTETILLGTVAIRRPDVKLHWDAKSMRITNDEKANAMLMREYRDGWQVKGISRNGKA